MPKPNIAIRLATEGGAEVRRDIEGIGSANEAAANRAQRAWERATEDLESAHRRQAVAAAKIAAIVPQSRAQMRIGDAVGTGFGEYEGSARASAAAFRDLVIEQERYEQGAMRLRAAIDPTFAAQQRFNAEMAEAKILIANGAISLDEYSKKLWMEREALEASTVGHAKVSTTSNAMKAGLQQAGFQLQDFLVQVNGGTSALRAFSMQAPQMIGALQLIAHNSDQSTGKMGAFLRLLSGGWGVALGIAIPAGAMLAEYLLNMGNEADKTTGKLRAQIPVVGALAGAYEDLAAAMNKAGAKSAEALGKAAVQVKMDEAAIGRLRLASQTADKRLEDSRRVDPKGRGSAPLIRAADEAREELRFAEQQLQVSKNLVAEAQKRFVIANETKNAEREARVRTPRTPASGGGSRTTSAEPSESIFVTNDRWARNQDVGASSRDWLTQQGDAAADARSRQDDYVADMAAGTALLKMELQLRGESQASAADALELEKFRLDVMRQFPKATAEFIAEQVAAKKGQLEMNELLRQYGRDWQEMTSFGEGFVDTVLSPETWSSWGDAGKRILGDLQAEMLKLAVINPLKNMLFNKSGSDALPTLSSVFGLFGKKTPGNNAVGTEYWSGGMTYVGENGRELIDLPRGARVFNASDTRQMMQQRPQQVIFEVRGRKGDVFDAEVAMISDGRVAQAAPAIAAGSSAGAQVAMRRRSDRQLA